MSTLNHGFGFQVRNVLSGIEGGFGFGFVLGTNLTLDVQTVALTAVQNGTPYSLSYVNPADSTAKTIPILHSTAAPFQDRLPENVLITLTVPQSVLYQAFTETLTIEPNAKPVWRVRLEFNQSYAFLRRKRYL